MSEGFKKLRIDPRDFIGGPFEDCPKCRQHEFGVLHVHDNSYTRRCRSCWHTLTFVLPKLRKKVIYLDQFVFSNIMKMLSAETPGHNRAKAEPLWRELFESLGDYERNLCTSSGIASILHLDHDRHNVSYIVVTQTRVEPSF